MRGLWPLLTLGRGTGNGSLYSWVVWWRTLEDRNCICCPFRTWSRFLGVRSLLVARWGLLCSAQERQTIDIYQNVTLLRQRCIDQQNWHLIRPMYSRVGLFLRDEAMDIWHLTNCTDAQEFKGIPIFHAMNSKQNDIPTFLLSSAISFVFSPFCVALSQWA